MSRLVILTGATGGIGSSILEGLKTKPDFKVCAFSRKCIAEDSNISSIIADFSVPNYNYLDSLNAWMQAQCHTEEIILILAAASIQPIDAIGRFDDELLGNVETNVTSQICLINSVIKYAEEKRVPVRIVHFDSGAAYRPIGGWSLYCASKAYLSMFLKVLASEHNRYKIVLFDPGVVNTEMQQNIRNAGSDAFVDIESFRKLKADNKLQDPISVGNMVLSRYIFDWKAKAINEKYATYISECVE